MLNDVVDEFLYNPVDGYLVTLSHFLFVSEKLEPD